jgi:hypothetical protein
MNIANWSVKDAIEERVRQEDLAMWAAKPNPPIVNKPLPPKQEWSKTAKHVFGSAIQFISSLPKL